MMRMTVTEFTCLLRSFSHNLDSLFCREQGDLDDMDMGGMDDMMDMDGMMDEF